MEYTFHIFNKLAADGVSAAAEKFLDGEMPVIVCVGSDLAIGDSLGPVCGSMLQYKHAGKKILAVDAAVGGAGDVGLVKINDNALLPGAGANKKLGAIGDISVMGIVAEKSVNNFGLLNSTRFHLVYSMAEIISEGLAAVLWEIYGNKKSAGRI